MTPLEAEVVAVQERGWTISSEGGVGVHRFRATHPTLLPPGVAYCIERQTIIGSLALLVGAIHEIESGTRVIRERRGGNGD